MYSTWFLIGLFSFGTVFGAGIAHIAWKNNVRTAVRKALMEEIHALQKTIK